MTWITSTASAAPAAIPYSQRKREIVAVTPWRANSASRSGASRIAGTSATAWTRVANARPISAYSPTTSHARRPLEHDDEHEGDEQEQRVERVLRHHRSRVRHGRDRHRHHRRQQREAVADDPAREVERGHRGERHHERVESLHPRVGVHQVLEHGVDGADQQRVDDAVARIGLAADQRLPCVGEPAGDLRPDDLVHEDERGDHVPCEDGAEQRRDGDDRRQPRPARDPAERSTQARPRRGGGRSPSPRPSPPRFRLPTRPD